MRILSCYFSRIFRMFSFLKSNKKKVLVIDDEKNIVEMLASFLKLEGYAPLTAADAVAGLEMAYNKKPHLIILDAIMEPISGYDALEKLRFNPATQNTPVIMITAVDKKMGGAESAFDKGASAFMQKPLDLERLKKKIESLIGGPCIESA